MRKAIQFKLLLPRDVKAWLEQEARQNDRSQGAQVVSCLRERMMAAGVEFGDQSPAAGKARKANHQEEEQHAAE